MPGSEVVKIISHEIQPITNNRIANRDRALREVQRVLVIVVAIDLLTVLLLFTTLNHEII